MREGTLSLAIVSLLLQCALKTEESCEDVLAIVILQFPLTLHIGKIPCYFLLCGTDLVNRVKHSIGLCLDFLLRKGCIDTVQS